MHYAPRRLKDVYFGDRSLGPRTSRPHRAVMRHHADKMSAVPGNSYSCQAQRTSFLERIQPTAIEVMTTPVPIHRRPVMKCGARMVARTTNATRMRGSAKSDPSMTVATDVVLRCFMSLPPFRTVVHSPARAML